LDDCPFWYFSEGVDTVNWNLEEAVAYYKRQGAPGDQNALVSLLKEIQHENGGSLPSHIPDTLAPMLGIKGTFLTALIRRFPSLRLSDKPVLEICCGPNCPRRSDLMTFAEKTWGKSPAGFVLKAVPCMRLCGKGPNIRWKGQLFHGATETLLLELIDKP
jgi:NADH:ubiquinone oxidoreductase subunit E